MLKSLQKHGSSVEQLICNNNPPRTQYFWVDPFNNADGYAGCQHLPLSNWGCKLILIYVLINTRPVPKVTTVWHGFDVNFYLIHSNMQIEQCFQNRKNLFSLTQFYFYSAVPN